MGEAFPASDDMDEGGANVSEETIRVANNYHEWLFLREVFKVFQNRLKRAGYYAGCCGELFQKGSYAATLIANVDQSCVSDRGPVLRKFVVLIDGKDSGFSPRPRTGAWLQDKLGWFIHVPKHHRDYQT
jgi:hypothetical protein